MRAPATVPDEPGRPSSRPTGGRAWAETADLISAHPERAQRIIGSIVMGWVATSLLAGAAIGAGTTGLLWWWLA